VELPTYTNIWKIEKRLYKLYDFRLPMPLPIGQVATFLAIAVPYMLILTMAGMPFSHTWVWLYVLPPGVLAWLVTRPVLEGKRLPELVLSQLRYLSEPRTWCRMAPLAEKDEIAVVAKVWRRSAAGAAGQVATAQSAVAAGLAVAAGPAAAAESPAAGAPETEAPEVEAPEVQTSAADSAAGERLAVGDGMAVPERPVWPGRPAFSARAGTTQAGNAWAAAAQGPLATEATAASATGHTGTQAMSPAQPPERSQRPEPAQRAESPQPAQRAEPPQPARRSFTVRTDSSTARPLHVVERALRSSPGAPASGWHDRVVVVPGGHRPGKPDQVQRDQARARLPLAGPVRIVVLGCTAGAGQTVTTLLTGQLLASLRGEAVAVLDLSPGPGSLTGLARRIPRLVPGRRDAAGASRSLDAAGPDRERGLQVVTADSETGESGDAGQLMAAVVGRFPLTLADPAAAQVPRAVQAADQLVLVTPASADAVGALAMTLEWLDAHGHTELARSAVTVLNGVSHRTMAHVEKAAAVATGRCRAIVRVPWDSRLAGEGALGTATVQAYTALAGVLVSGLAASAALADSAATAELANAAAPAVMPPARARSADQ
jgi:hypothetical protein